MTYRTRIAVWAACAALLTVAPAAAAAVPGCVDSKDFLEIAGDEAVSVEVSLGGPLLRILTKGNPELSEQAGGLESIQAVILDLSGDVELDEIDPALVDRARELIASTQTRLKRGGWQRLARVRDGAEEVQVLVLSDDEVIQGLVVMVLDRNEGQMIFANLCGVLDLAAIQAIGEEINIPGLDELDSDADLGDGGD